MSFRWMKNMTIEGKEATVEVFLGDRVISDKCYVKINEGPEEWFQPKSAQRELIVKQALELIQNKNNTIS